MVYRLALVRHAKSDYPPGVADHERPLAGRGRRDAPFIGDWLTEQIDANCLALVSTALRARQTWELALERFAHSGEVRFEKAIYEAEPQDLLRVVSECMSEESNLIMVGHSPGLESLALRMANESIDDEWPDQIRTKFPTSACLLLSNPRPFADWVWQTCRLENFHVARSKEAPRT